MLFMRKPDVHSVIEGLDECIITYKDDLGVRCYAFLRRGEDGTFSGVLAEPVQRVSVEYVEGLLERKGAELLRIERVSVRQ